MRIGNISNRYAKPQTTKNVKNKDNKNNNSAASKTKNKDIKADALRAALLTSAILTSCAAADGSSIQISPDIDVPNKGSDTHETQSPDMTLEQAGENLDASLNAHVPLNGKIQLTDVGFAAFPITEFYFTNSDGEVELHPNESIPRNDGGSVIVTITEKKSDDVKVIH